MASLVEKGILAIIALIIIFYMATPLVTALNAVNLTDVGGQDLTWVVTIVGIIFFAGLAVAVYYVMIGKGK